MKCIATHGNLRGVALDGTSLVKEAARLHSLVGEEARALGETVLASLLLSSYCKQGERVNLNILGSGRIMQALADAYPDGTVRGYVVPRESGGDTEGQGPWGRGLMSVLRTKDGEGQQPYIGTVPMITGHLAKDLTFYWLQSEQIPSSVGIRIDLNEKGQITHAGAFLVQVLPGASAEEVLQVENHIENLAALEARITGDERDPMRLLSAIFQDTVFMVVEDRPLTFKCRCSRERVERSLLLIGRDELRSMLDGPGKAEVRCDFCATDYLFSAADLTALIKQLD